MKNRVLITGATGFVGGKVVEALSRDGDTELHVLARDEGRARAVLPDNVIVHTGDITCIGTLKRPLAGKEAVIHCAALMSNFDSESRETFHRVNVAGTENLLRSCDRGSLKQFIHISTVGVYGPTGATQADESASYGKTLSDYEWSKMMAEKALFRTARESSLPFTVLRLSQMYGEGMRYGWPETMRSIKAGSLMLPGNGRAKIHLLHIDDLVNAVKLALFNEAALGKVYNIGGPETFEIRKVFDVISKILLVEPVRGMPYLPVYAASILLGALPGRLKSGKMKFFTPHRVSFFAEDHAYDISRASRELKYVPSVNIGEGFGRMAEWCRREGLLA